MANTSTTDNGRFGLSAQYANGPFNMDAIYQTQLNVHTVYPTPGLGLQGHSINEWFVGAGYDFKLVKIMGTYQTLDNNNHAPGTVETLPRSNNINANAKLWSLGAIIPVSAVGKVRIEYAQVDFSQNDRANVAPALQVDGTSRGWGLGYTHDLSKRTFLYASVASMNNDKNSLALGAAAAGANTGALGETNYSLLTGVRHSF